MRKLLTCSVALLCAAAPASAAVTPTLTSITADGSNFSFNYDFLLAADQGVTSGSKVVIVDFAGYVADSIFGPAGLPVSYGTEAVTTDLALAQGAFDSPDLLNLVFTYTGPDYHVSGGPFAPENYGSFGAVSTFDLLTLGSYTARGVKNIGMGPGGTGSAAFNQGFVSVPTAIPEPATWALLVSGFGLTGYGLRRRRPGTMKDMTA